MIVVTDEGGRDRLVNYIEWVSVYTESYIQMCLCEFEILIKEASALAL